MRVAAATTPPASSEHHDPELFEQLRKLRKALADRAGVPAYVIFSDRALLEMATFFPQDEDQFLGINGDYLDHYTLLKDRPPLAPIHFIAATTTQTFGPYPGVFPWTYEAVCFDATQGVLGSVSTVSRLTVY